MLNKKTYPFVGRKHELSILKDLLRKRVASLIVLKGRRRIGKSRLAEEFSKSMRSVIFTGLPPDKNVTAQSQREDFAQQLSKALNIPPPRSDDWNTLFWNLAHETKKGRVFIVLDEITWLGSKDPTFLGKLKNAWDLHFKKNPGLILMLTGSMSGWIEKNILSSTGFMGRISLDIKLEELPLYRCNSFWGKENKLISPYEKFKVLAVTGGIPRYLEEIIPEDSAEKNIQRLCFRREGFLFNEFDRIFSDLFQKRAPIYTKIVHRLANGATGAQPLYEAAQISKGGVASSYLSDLQHSGFISRDYTWNITRGTESKQSLYRLSDNYTRFYLKYILPNKRRIEGGRFNPDASRWSSIFGLQFENLVLNNRNRILELLKINPEHVVWDNPFLQTHTKKHRGCQVDYLIQTRDGTLYVCEIKFSQHPIGREVIDEVRSKISVLNTPRNFSFRSILIHVNGVSDAVLEEEFFSEILSFSDILI
jgi:AAA+ ATPase superfamily predicted ATPase